MSKFGGISYEPCTLVYTLLDPNQLNFDDFSLIIRSLHSFMVDSIVPNPEMNNVHVKLNYQASMDKAQQKLGKLRSIVGVAKLSSHVKESEFSRLELLRRQYGIGDVEPDTPAAAMYQRAGPSRPRRGRGAASRVFAARPAPYTAKPKAQEQVPLTCDIAESEETYYEDGQPNMYLDDASEV